MWVKGVGLGYFEDFPSTYNQFILNICFIFGTYRKL